MDGVSSGNMLYYGDNLTIMRNMPADSVDLIYLDPPFNSKRTYNLLYKTATGAPVPEQVEAFCDAWELDAEKIEMVRKMPSVLREYGMDATMLEFWQTWMNALKSTQPKLLAYLIYMFYRLVVMRRVLKPSGSIYLHCDPTASHYIKVLMDGVFGHDNFQNEIIWCYKEREMSKSRYNTKHDVILFYSKGKRFYFDWKSIAEPYSEITQKKFKYEDENGKYQIRGKGVKGSPVYKADGLRPEHEIKYPGLTYRQYEGMGVPPRDWVVIPILNKASHERLGYPTQKPPSLLNRIIRASCPKNGVVFDPFCGCGTSIYSAINSQRKWIGCDIAILSIKLIQEVLERRHGLLDEKDYAINGIPVSVEQAQELFRHDPFQFQHWAVELAGGFCNSKKTADKGIDGAIYYEVMGDKGKVEYKKVIVSVKGGHLRPADIRDLHGVLASDYSAEMAAFICLQTPTKQQREAAVAAGIYEYKGITYDRLQIRTIAELLDGRGFDTPTKVRLIHKEKQYGLAM